MLEKRTVIDKIEVNRDGMIYLRFAKEILEDGVVIAKGYHKTSINADTDFDIQMDAVNTNLQMLKAATVDTTDRAWIKSMRNSIQTADRNQRWREKRQKAEQEALQEETPSVRP